jgi:hypothetical protein
VQNLKQTKVLSGVDPKNIPYRELLDAQEPVILRGAVADWPLVSVGLRSPKAAMDYLLGFYNGRPVTSFVTAPEEKGRFFYTEDLTDRNFDASSVELGTFLERVQDNLGNADAPGLYVGSTDLNQHFPGFSEANGLSLDDPMFQTGRVFSSAWIGNRTTAATHYDMSNNIACCLVGSRRFTLFPPDQIANLYPGPLERTPGGQVVSMVDLRAPDFDKYPRFEDALQQAEVAELEAGDLLLYPALWWHNVEALDDFNIMVNYWWNDTPAFLDNPMDTLMHGMLSLRDRPEAEKNAWRALFDYYVFGPSTEPAAHLPEEARGALSPMDEMQARRMRMMLLQRLNR